MFRNRSVDVHQFAMIPKADIPRSRFKAQKTHKTTFDAGYLIPVYVDEVLPGDYETYNLLKNYLIFTSLPRTITLGLSLISYLPVESSNTPNSYKSKSSG